MFEDSKQKFVSSEAVKSMTKAKGFDHMLNLVMKLNVKYGRIKNKLKKLGISFQMINKEPE